MQSLQMFVWETILARFRFDVKCSSKTIICACRGRDLAFFARIGYGILPANCATSCTAASTMMRPACGVKRVNAASCAESGESSSQSTARMTYTLRITLASRAQNWRTRDGPYSPESDQSPLLRS